MSYIPVRLIQAVLAIVAAVAVGGSSWPPCQLEQSQPAKTEPSVRIEKPREAAPQSSVALYGVKAGKCAAPDTGTGLSYTLAKLVRYIQPDIPLDQVQALADKSLLDDARQQTPDGGVDVNVAATVCVVRYVNDDNQVVWRVHFPGSREALQMER